MRKFVIFKKMLKALDLFYSSEILNYNNQAQYKTITGGFISLLMIVAVMVGFSSMILSSIQRTSITSNMLVQKQKNPPKLELVPGQQYFMVGVSVMNISDLMPFDLNHGQQFFDIVLKQVLSENGQFIHRKTLKLEECTRQHWAMDPSAVENFDNMMMGTYNCLELNSNITLAGIYGSPVFSHLQFEIHPCVNTTQNKNKCASQEQIDDIFNRMVNFYFSVTFLNPVINPNQPDYIQYSQNNQNYFIISKQIGVQTWLQLTDFTINSDNSILPFEDKKVDKGFLVQNKLLFVPYDLNYKPGDYLAQLNVAKSTKSLIYNRQVLKISTVISYVGGMIGAIAAVLFAIKSYTDSSLQMAISLQTFSESSNSPHDTEDKPKQQLKFNFLNYISLRVYQILNWFKKRGGFETSKKLDQYQTQITKQLDIKYLLKRILKIQLFISTHFNEEQIKVVKNYRHISHQIAKQLRTLLEEEQEYKEDAQNQKTDNFNDMAQKTSQKNQPTVMKSEFMTGFPSNQRELNSQIDYNQVLVTENPLRIKEIHYQNIVPDIICQTNDYMQPNPHSRKNAVISKKQSDMIQIKQTNQKINGIIKRKFIKEATTIFSAKDIIQLRKQK